MANFMLLVPRPRVPAVEDLLRDLAGRDYDLGERDPVVGDEDDAQPVARPGSALITAAMRLIR